MATQLQIRRGTTAQTNSFTGAEGELSVNTTTDTVHVHDGSTAGGHGLAKADGSNIATYAGSFTTLAASGATTLSSTLAVTGGVTSGAHLINAASSAFGASSVQGFNTDFLIDTGQGYARHNSYHTGGSNHQFLVNEASSTTNAVALSIAKDKSAIFSGSVDAGAGLRFSTDGSNNGVITTLGQNKGLYFAGDDGGVGINALVLDMSAAGAATFNAGVFAGSASSFPSITINNNSYIGSANNSTAMQIATSGAATFNAGVTAASLVAGATATNGIVKTFTADIGNGETSGLNLFNSAGSDTSWFITPGVTGVNNTDFCIRDATNNVNALRLAVSTGAATFHSTVTAKSLTLNASAASSFSIINGGTNAIAMKAAAGDELYIGANNTYALRFLNNGTNNVVLDNGSNLLVGGTADRGGRICVGGNSTTARILPQTDNVGFIGQGTFRWQEIYAVNGSIVTSDRTEKQDIEALSDAEKRVAVAAKGLMRKFRWKDAVAEKGDDARIHFGIIAQDLQDAFTAEGLNAGRYSMFISDTWWEIQTEVAAVEATEIAKAVDAYTRTDTFNTAEEAPQGATERTRCGVRYNELLAFIIAAI